MTARQRFTPKVREAMGRAAERCTMWSRYRDGRTGQPYRKDHLLLIQPDLRDEAKILRKKLETILSKAKADPSYLFSRIDPPSPIPQVFGSVKYKSG